MDGTYGLFLVAVNMGDGPGNAPAHERVEDVFGDKIFHGNALSKGAGQTDVRPFFLIKATAVSDPGTAIAASGHEGFHRQRGRP
jgi:hypothetical protein